MRYRELRVPPPLDALIECVWFLSAAPAGGAAAPAEQRILPDGCIELVWHFGDRFLAVSADGIHVPQPRCFIVGMLTSPLAILPGVRADTMGVRFRPGGAYRVVPGPLIALSHRAVDLEALWGASADELWEQLAAVSDDAARVRLVCAALVDRLWRTPADDLTASAVAALVRSAGRAPIATIAAGAGVTTRHLQRRFAARVGAGPKTLARILRFQHTLRLRGDGETARTDWVRVAADSGYADQSHLIRDYGEFAGETPASLRAAEGELSSYFTAPQRLAALFDTRRYG